MKRKLLSIVLALTMALGMLPAAALAETTESCPGNESCTHQAAIGNTHYDTLAEAVSKANDGDTVKLLADAELTETLNINKAITLDGANHKITGKPSTGKTSFITVKTNGDFTMKNATILPTKKVEANPAIDLQVKGKVIIDNCVFGAAEDTKQFMYNGLEFSQNKDCPMADGTTISNCTFYGGSFRHNFISFYCIAEGATININGNKFLNANWDTTNAIRVSNYGSANATINLIDDTYSDSGSDGNKDYAGLLFFQRTKNHNDDFTKLTVNIKGLDTTEARSDQLFYVYDDHQNSIISTNQPIVKGDSSIENFFVAKVGDTYYKTLADAVTAADNTTVTLLKDTTENVTIPTDKTITLDLNGKKLVNSAAAQDNTIADRKHTITNNGTLTIKDSVGGGIVDNVSHQCAAIKNNVGGTVTIENGTFCRTAEASVDADNSGNNSYYVIDNQGTMNINGGMFKFSDTKNGAYSSLIHNGWYDGTKNTEKAPAKMTITDGNFTQGTGGKITVKNDDYGELKIQGGTFTQPQAGYYCVFNWNVAEITGGTINGPVGCGGNESIEADKGQLAIGGTAHINGELQKDTSSGEPSISVSGGTFSSEVKPEYCAEGYIPKDNGDGTYGVTRPSSSSSSRYNVTAPKADHGTVTVTPSRASKGDTVTVTVKPDSGYVLETITVLDKDGKELELTDKGDGKYTFTMPRGAVTVKATFMEDNTVLNFFYDVPNDAYYYEAVKWAVEKGITSGIGNDLFGSNDPCTRAQIVTFLWRAAGSPEPKALSSFTDVPADAWYTKAVAWAVENGVTAGVGDNLFGSGDTCTRAQSVTFLFKALKATAKGQADFKDVSASDWYAKAVAWAVENGVTAGVGGGLFGSGDDCTRAQIVTFLFKAYQGK